MVGPGEWNNNFMCKYDEVMVIQGNVPTVWEEGPMGIGWTAPMDTILFNR